MLLRRQWNSGPYFPCVLLRLQIDLLYTYEILVGPWRWLTRAALQLQDLRVVLLHGTDHLLAHRAHHRDDEALARRELLLNLLGDRLRVIRTVRQVQVVLRVAGRGEERKLAIVRDVHHRVPSLNQVFQNMPSVKSTTESPHLDQFSDYADVTQFLRGIVLRVIVPSELRMEKKKCVLVLVDVRDAHVVRGGAQVLVLLAREDVDADDVRLGVAVLARLRPAKNRTLINQKTPRGSNFTPPSRAPVGTSSSRRPCTGGPSAWRRRPCGSHRPASGCSPPHPHPRSRTSRACSLHGFTISSAGLEIVSKNPRNPCPD